MRVCRTAVTMRGPPLAPRAPTRRPCESCRTTGDMLLRGFLPGLMKLGALGSRPYTLAWSGVLKSSIWLFSISPALDVAMECCLLIGTFDATQLVA